MEGSHHENILDSYESTENALMDSFKAAALKVTTLYKDSLVQNRKSYAAGYQQALQDLFEFISTQPESEYIPVENVLSFARQRNNQLTTDHNNNTTHTTTPNNIKPTTPEPQLNKVFSIDPHAQFTFTHDAPNTTTNVWDQSSINFINDFNKRRIPEVSFMGRTMDLNGIHEPPFKRRSRREEQLQLQQQQHIQQQQQQIQQQQLQLQQLQQQQQQHIQQQQQSYPH